MQISLKSTILLSSLVALGLNAAQYISGLHHPKEAFSPAWAYTANSPTPSPLPVAVTTPIPTPATSSINPTIAAAAAKLSAAGLKADYADLYLAVQAKTGTPWQLLAAVHRAETHQSGNTGRSSYAGAVGPMQFLPSTFRSYASDGDANGTQDITDLEDSMLAAGRYLAANGANRGQYSNALYRYNHSWSYVSAVTSTARRLGL